MAKNAPDSMPVKRALLFSEGTTDAQRNAMADRFVAEERYGEAFEFLEQSKDEERLSRIEARARELGDSFLLLSVERIRKRPVAEESWRETAKTALRLGKYLDAYRAHLHLSEEERAEEIRSEHMPAFKPFRPDGK